MSKYIDAEKLIAEIERYKQGAAIARFDNAGENADYFQGKVDLCDDLTQIITSLQQEQHIKVYRVENEKEQKGLWRKFDGTWEPLFDVLTDGQCKDMPMEDSPIYREGGKQWFASAPSRETLQKWFSKRDLEELTAKGFTISEFEVVGHKKISDFEYIFTRDSIISRTYLKVSDIYPQEQPELSGNEEDGIPGKDFIPVAWVDACERYGRWKIVQQEQPEVDLEKEYKEYVEDDPVFSILTNRNVGLTIARHFFELGLNARKEK